MKTDKKEDFEYVHHLKKGWFKVAVKKAWLPIVWVLN
jgi:hypothetical protein